MSAVAQAALPVAVALAILAGAARALVTEVAFAGEHLEALCTWCLLAVAVFLGALVVEGDAGIVPVLVGLGLGVVALVLRPGATVEEPPAPRVEEPATPVERSTGALWARPRG